jgi:hypothetical protein
VAVVVRVGELAGFPDAPSAGDDDMVVQLSDDSAALGKLWGMVLLVAVRDHASSIHYHPWREDGGLSVVVANVRYVMVPPPPHLVGPLIAVARSLFTRPGRSGWFSRGAGGGPVCKTVELDVWGHTSVWDAIVWSSGERSGVELFRIEPTVAEQSPAPGAVADGGA